MRDVRQILIGTGVQPYLADMIIPFVWFGPGTTDPDAAAVIEMTRAVQRGLRAGGFRQVQVSGVMDEDTAGALVRICGPWWLNKPWIEIIECSWQPQRWRAARGENTSLGAYILADRPAGPLPGPLGMGATATDGGVNLEFGLGVSNKQNIIPIPRRSGSTYAAFTNLQRQVNRLLSTKGGGRVSEDGVIGAGTLTGFKKVAGWIASWATDNTVELAEKSVSIGSVLKKEADRRGISPGANRAGSGAGKAAASSDTTPGPMTPDERDRATGGTLAKLKKYAPWLALAAGVAVAATKLREE